MVYNSGNWLQILKRLNPKLRVAWLSESKMPPGIYYLTENKMDYEPVCATDPNYVKEHSEYDQQGHRLHTGWRFVVWTLFHLKLTTADKIKAIWPGFFEYNRLPKPDKIMAKVKHEEWKKMVFDEKHDKFFKTENLPAFNANPILDRQKELQVENYNKTGSSALTRDNIAELGSKLEENMSEDKKAQRERERRELQMWKERGGAPSDKPEGFSF